MQPRHAASALHPLQTAFRMQGRSTLAVRPKQASTMYQQLLRMSAEQEGEYMAKCQLSVVFEGPATAQRQ